MELKFVVFFVLSVEFTVSAKKNKDCSRCIRIEDCKAYGDSTKNEQDQWLATKSCEGSHDDDDEMSAVFGFAPFAKGDYICCPNRTRTSSVDFGGPETNSKLQQQPVFANPAQNNPETESRFWNRNNNLNIPNYPQFTNNGFSRQRPQPQQNNNFGNNQGFQNNWNEANKRRPNTLQNGNNNFYDIDQPRNHHSGGSNTQYPRNDNNFRQPPRNQYPQSEDPYITRTTQSNNGRNMNDIGSPNIGGQCQLTSNPPSVDSGCCGLHADFSDRITGGSVTEVDQFPWLVLLKSVFVDNSGEESAFNCGGSLISATFVLTAGHCLHDEKATLGEVEVTLAEFDKRTYPRDCSNGEEGLRCINNVQMFAENVIVHPNYDDTKLQNDIALIRLRGKAPYTEFIRPICLPSGDIDSQEFKNQPLFVAGWGRDGIYNSNVKQSTIVNLVPQGDCKKSYSFLTRRHLCAAGYNGQDTCKGDSGGPLMLNLNGRYFVTGVVSGKRADSPCGTAVPSLYTNVYHYLDWIMNTMRD